MIAKRFFDQTAHNVRTSPDGKFLVKFFSKNLRGQEGQSPRKTALFFLQSFFFCASCVKRKSGRTKINFIIKQRTIYALIYFTRHPERSRAESNFFVLDPKRRSAPFAPHCVRSSTTLRMTQTKKHRAKRGGIYKKVTHNVRTNPTEKFLRSFFQKATKKNGAFLFAKLFLLRLLCQKKKR